MRVEAVRRRNGAALAGLGLLFVAASAVGVEIGGPEMIDTEPPKEVPVEEPLPEPEPPEAPEPLKAPAGEPEGIAPLRPSPESAREPRKGALGLRTGVLLLGPGDAAYDPSLLLGLYYRPRRTNGKRLGYELAVQVGSRSGGEVYESLPAGGSFSLLYWLSKGESRAEAYLLYGLGGLMESVTQESTGDRYTNYAATLDMAAGLALLGGRLDLRATSSFLLGSENLVGYGVLAAGYSF